MSERIEAGSGDGLVVEGQRFAIVPEWVIDADVGDCAFRLYAVLLRYGQTSGARMPSRATLARRLRKRSVDTVDRAMKELVTLGAVRVERRHDGKQNLTNLYHVRTTDPGRTDAATPAVSRPGRTVAAGYSTKAAATPDHTDAATPAAVVRPNPESSTESHPPPPGAELARQCRELRRSHGLSWTGWSPSSVASALARAGERGWPVEAVEDALLALAADPETRSPMRVAEAGPWWGRTNELIPAINKQLDKFESLLDAVDGQRPYWQQLARAKLAAAGRPLTRATVVTCAVELLAGKRQADLPPS